MAPPTLQEQLSVTFTETLAKLVFRYYGARRVNRRFNPGVEDRLIVPGIIIRIDGSQWLHSHKDQEALIAYLLERAKRYPWYADDLRQIQEIWDAQRALLQQQQQQQSPPTLARQPGTSQELSSSASAGQRSMSLPPSFSSTASLQPQAQAPIAGQRDQPFHQNVQQPHQPRVVGHGGSTQQPQDQSARRPQGQQTQGSTLPPIQGLGSPPRQAQTQSHVPGPTLPSMHVLQLDPSAPPVAARGHPQRSDTSVAPAGRLSFPPATLAQGQAYNTTTVAAGARPQMMIPRPVCDNCGEDINICGCISGDEDEVLVKEARKIRERIEKIDAKQERPGSMKYKDYEKKTKLEQDNKRTLRRADIIIQARWNRKARLARDVAIADLGRSQELNSQGHQHSTTLVGKGYTNPFLEQASPTLGSKPAVSEAGGNSRTPGNGKVGAKPQSLTLSGDREDDTQLESPASEKGPASQGQSVPASNRRVTDPSPSPGAMNAAAALMRAHRPGHLQGTKGTKESGIDPRSTSPRKADGGEEWHGKYRDRQSPPGQDKK